jgi:hypothetical protein
MDDYTLQQELEVLAGNAFKNNLDFNADTALEPMKDTINRWQKLFNLSSDGAVDRIQEHRNNLTRTRIMDDHWEIIRSDKAAQGYDREAYEYELELQKKKAALPDLLPSAEDSNVTYLVELAGPLSDPNKVQRAAGMEETPAVVSGKSLEEDRPVWLCCIDGAAKNALLRWAAIEGGAFEPTILVNPKSLR